MEPTYNAPMEPWANIPKQTVAEFLAAGGVVTRLPPSARHWGNVVHTVKVRTVQCDSDGQPIDNGSWRTPGPRSHDR